MKICVISFDYWNYDVKIVDKLNELGYNAFHIKLGDFKYKYPSFIAKINNFFSKLLFDKNIKKVKTEEYLLSVIDKKGKQDKILVINPERISLETHLKIKKYTTNYKTYLYDSIDRYDNKKLIEKKVFDTIYSFDKKDAIKYNLKFITNYIHLEKKNITEKSKFNVFSISSIDDRYATFNAIIEYFDNNNISHQTLFYDKKKPQILKKSATFINKTLNHDKIQEKMEESDVILDVLRKNQTGLSFRVFDALALNKKLITTNQSIKEYDFYNENNICVIDKNTISIPNNFLNTKYEKLSNEIYKKYSLENWVKTVFELEKNN